VNLQQGNTYTTTNKVQQQQPNQNFDQIYYQNSSYSPPVSNLILSNNLMLNNISQTVQNSTNSLNSNPQSHNIDQLQFYSESDQNSVNLKKLLIDQDQEMQQHQYNNGQTQVSSSSSSAAPTPTPFHQQQFFFSGASDQSNLSKYNSPSESPPPPQVQPYHNGTRSLSKSPVRNANNSQQNGQLQENGNLNGSSLVEETNLERRHAEKMEFYLAFVEKYNYKVSFRLKWNHLKGLFYILFFKLAAFFKHNIR